MSSHIPTGYTGHVTKVRHVVGQTNGKMVREAINTLTPSTELAAVKPVNTPTDWNSVADKDRLVSTQQISYTKHPTARWSSHSSAPRTRFQHAGRLICTHGLHHPHSCPTYRHPRARTQLLAGLSGQRLTLVSQIHTSTSSRPMSIRSSVSLLLLYHYLYLTCLSIYYYSYQSKHLF